MIQRITVENLELGTLNILVGPNGSGKSNFLGALGFWADMLQNKPEEGSTAFHQELSKRGWDRLLKFRTEARTIRFAWDFIPEVEKGEMKYSLNVHVGESAANRQDYYISREELSYATPISSAREQPYYFYKCHETPNFGFFSIRGSKQRRLSVRNNEVVTLQLNELRDEDREFDSDYHETYSGSIQMLEKYLSRFFCYSCSNFNINALKKPVSMNQANGALSPDASNLANILLRWKTENFDFFLQYREMVAPLFGYGEDISIDIDPIPGTTDMQLALTVGRQRYYPADLSDGTLRAMILAALLVDRLNQMSVCAIDEPELNLHPEWQSRFCDWLLASGSSRQYFISTHSPEILDPLTHAFMEGEAKVLVFSNNRPIRALERENIRALYDEGFNLGDLYRSKAIEVGGWPE